MAIYTGKCTKCGHLNTRSQAHAFEGEWAEGFAADCTGKADNEDKRCFNEVFLQLDENTQAA